jgi:CHAT domain-containing protein
MTDGASKADVAAALGRGKFVHVASHAQWWPEDHFASALLFDQADGADGLMTAAEIHRDLDLRRTELVLLAACETGRGPGRRRSIEFYNGLDGAFLAQGARAVVSALWGVNDFATFLFMTNMHVALKDSASVASAFESSVRFLRAEGYRQVSPKTALARALDASGGDWRDRVAVAGSRYAEPYYWAPFRLSGAHWVAAPV